MATVWQNKPTTLKHVTHPTSAPRQPLDPALRTALHHRRQDDPLPAAATLFGVGVWMGTAQSFSMTMLCSALAVCIVTYAAGYRKTPTWVLLLTLGMLRGCSYTALRPPDVLHVASGGRILLRGHVAEPETVTPKACRFIVKTNTIAWCKNNQWQSAHLSARILVNVPNPRTPKDTHWPAPAHWGQEICVRGKCDKPPQTKNGDFDYTAWLADRDIHEIVETQNAGDVTVCGPSNLPFPTHFAATTRHHIEETFESHLPQPHASLLEGIVLAEGKTLPKDVGDAFRATGTYHVLITAGIHMNFVIAASIAILGAFGVGGGRAGLVTIPLITFYALVTGASPSITRAAIMGTISLLGHAAGRDSTSARGLACAVIIMTAYNPSLVRDAGFQMSLAAVLGIQLLAPIFERKLHKLPKAIRGVVAVTAATQCMVAPLAAMYFGTTSLFGIAANVVVVPLCEALLACGLSLTVCGGANHVFETLHLSTAPWHLIMHAIATIAWGISSLVLAIVTGLKAIPGCEMQVEKPAGGELVAIYMIIWAFRKLLNRQRVVDRVRFSRGAILGLLFAVVLFATGCVRGIAEDAVRKSLPNIIGPAEKYEVKIEHSSDSQIMHGDIQDLTVVGLHVKTKDGLTIKRLTVKMHGLKVDTHKKSLTSVEQAVFDLDISQEDLSVLARDKVHKLGKPVVLLSANSVTVALPAKVLSASMDVTLHGALSVQEGQRVLFVPDKMTVGLLPIPSMLLSSAIDRINPVADLRGLPVPVQIDSLTTESGVMNVKGRLFVPTDASAPKK